MCVFLCVFLYTWGDGVFSYAYAWFSYACTLLLCVSVIYIYFFSSACAFFFSMPVGLCFICMFVLRRLHVCVFSTA